MTKNPRKILAALAWLAWLPLALTAGPAPAAGFHPAAEWVDNHGVPINAHGGGVIFHAGRYYWYGEHKLAGRSEKEGAGGGVHCYSSTNLYDWQDEGLALATDAQNPASEIAVGCILERPKVLFNARTRTFVMFFKLYPVGQGYDTGYVGVATATAPNGPFTYRHRFLGGGSPKGSGDFAMVQDETGAVHHLTVRKPDKVFVAGRLRDDYLFPAGSYAPVEGIELHTEAPAVLQTGGACYLIGSGSSSWRPNAARSFVAATPTGPYLPLGNPTEGINSRNGLGPEVTFGGQISFILPVPGKKDAFIAMFDLWQPERPIEGRYMWLPVTIENGRPSIQWRDTWDLSVFDQSPVPAVATLPEVRLWAGDAPGALGPNAEDIPTLTVYLPDAGKKNGASMLVLPGGGYAALAAHEGAGYAAWLAANGVTAYVLKYRLGKHGYRHPVMWQDAARGLRLVRQLARQPGLDPQRVGLIGSSAGGHLASTLITHFDAGDPAAADPVEQESSRPDVAVLCYPVISLGEFTHAGSRRQLLGESPAPELVHALSNELQVTASTPPTFIWHTGEDKTVPVENALMFAAALRQAGVPFALHVYEKGPHGLGLGNAKRPAPAWAEECLSWLRGRQFLP